MIYGLGVDLGTTFTAVAVGRHDRATMVTLGSHSVVTPAVVFASRNGQLLTGEPADRRAAQEPGRSAREFKRRLGDPTPLPLGGAPYPPSVLLAATLRDAVETAVRAQGEPPARIVLSRPAVWGRYRLEQFDEVPRLAGLDDVGLVIEPVAAATHYAASHSLSDGDVVAVYDLGGGTFDAAVLRVEAGRSHILAAPDGVEWLGGVDFDEAILSHVDRELDGAVSAADPDNLEDAVALARLRRHCVLAKEALSFDDEATIPAYLPAARRDVLLTRAQFEDMIRPSVESTVEALHRALSSADVEPNDLSAVLLAGGSSRIPIVARMVEAAMNRPTVLDAHPKHVVALGAARVAASAAARLTPGGALTWVPAGRADVIEHTLPVGATPHGEVPDIVEPASAPSPGGRLSSSAFPERRKRISVDVPALAGKEHERRQMLLLLVTALLGLVLAALIGILYGYGHRSRAASDSPGPVAVRSGEAIISSQYSTLLN